MPVALGIAGLALLVRVWLIVGYGSSDQIEVFEYDQLARNLLAGRGYVYHHLGTDYRALFSGVPYVAICATLYTLFAPGYTAVLLAQSLCSAVLAIVAWAIGRQLWDGRAGLVGAGLVALHPGLLFYDTHRLHPLSFDALTIALATWLLIRMRSRMTARAAIVAGFAAGLSTLQRGTMAVFVILGLGWLWRVRRHLRPWVIQGAAFVAAALLVLAPWIARNYVLFGTVVLTTNAGEFFWRGNEPQSVGGSYLPSGATVLATAPVELRQALSGADELGQSRVFLAFALANIRAHPAGFLAGLARKWVTFWTFGAVSGLLYPRWYFHVYFAYYSVVATLAVVGIVWCARHRGPDSDAVPGLLGLLAAMVSVASVQSVFYVELRHRWGIEPLIVVLAGVGGVYLWSRARLAMSQSARATP